MAAKKRKASKGGKKSGKKASGRRTSGRKASGRKTSGKKASKKKNKGKSQSKSKPKAKKKSAPKPPAAAKALPLGGPFPVATGAGASPLELATRVAALLRDGKSNEVEDLLFHALVESVEGVGASMAWRGKQAVLKKYRDWEADHDVHSMQVEGPWVGATGFALKFVVDLSQRSTGQRHQMEEIAVYTVQDGKIVREEFHFAL